MSGGQIIRPSGRRLILPSGKLAICNEAAGACCDGGSTPCWACAGQTPSQIVAAFSDIENCYPTCRDNIIIEGDVNGGATLPQTAACVWSAWTGKQVTFSYYKGDDCATLDYSITFDKVAYLVYIENMGGGLAQICAEISLFSTDPPWSDIAFLGKEMVDPSDPDMCMTPRSLQDTSGYPCGDGGNAFYGGTATIVPIA